MSAMFNYGIVISKSTEEDASVAFNVCEYMVKEGIVDLIRDVQVWNSKRPYDPRFGRSGNPEPFKPTTLEELEELFQGEKLKDIYVNFSYRSRYGSRYEHPENVLTDIVENELMEAAGEAAKSYGFETQLDFYGSCSLEVDTIESFDEDKMEPLWVDHFVFCFSGDGYISQNQPTLIDT